MSLRPRQPPKQPVGAARGSLFTQAIDYKPQFAMGVRLTPGAAEKQELRFLVKFYYGKSTEDADVSFPKLIGRDQDYLRVQIKYVHSADAVKFGDMVMNKLHGGLSEKFNDPPGGRFVRVCSNPEDSYYANYMLPKQSDQMAAPSVSFSALAKVVANGAATGTSFKIDEHEYTYMLRDETRTAANMWLTRKADGA